MWNKRSPPKFKWSQTSQIYYVNVPIDRKAYMWILHFFGVDPHEWMVARSRETPIASIHGHFCFRWPYFWYDPESCGFSSWGEHVFEVIWFLLFAPGAELVSSLSLSDKFKIFESLCFLTNLVHPASSTPHRVDIHLILNCSIQCSIIWPILTSSFIILCSTLLDILDHSAESHLPSLSRPAILHT